MEKKYLKYSLEILIEDKEFVAWVLKDRQDREWRNFLENHPEFHTRSKKAREIILLLRDTYKVLEEDEVLKMWQNINQFDQRHKKNSRTLQLRRMVNWAASILIIVSLGIVGFYYLNNKNLSYQFVSAESLDIRDEARIVLSDGEQIFLEKDKSTLVLTPENELIINNKNTIDLSGKNDDIQMNEVIVPFGKRSELKLADGTEVWLNAGSRLAFPSKFSEKTRDVFLEGEACFKVARNTAQPFIVNADKLGIEVLGTHFDVIAYPGEKSVETILLEGSVKVSKKSVLGLTKREVILEPYQKATFSKTENDIMVSVEPDADVYVTWTVGWFDFSQESLHTVFTKLERYYNIEVVVPKGFPSNEKITGKLDLKDSLEDVMRALADVAKISYRINDKQIYIEKEINKIPRK